MSKTRKINLNWRLKHDCPECGTLMDVHPQSKSHNICGNCNDIYKVGVKRNGSVSISFHSRLRRTTSPSTWGVSKIKLGDPNSISLELENS